MIGLSLATMAWGCGSKDSTATDSATPTPTVAADDTTTQVPVKEAYEVNNYITLGEYKGLTAVYTKLEVTDADVEEVIKSELEANATEEEVTGRPVQEGDIVNIDYEGLKDGVAFDGGTAQGQDLTIGSGSFIDGFEDGLIGKNIGEKVALNLTFPENYSATDLAGQAVVFNVTINSIKVSKVPELTEEYVKENTEYDSIEAYKQAIRDELQASNEETMENEKISNLLTTVVENATISSYPQTLIDYYGYELESMYTQYAQLYGMELADFISANGLTQEAYDAQKKEYAEGSAAREMALYAIIKAENITISDEEYRTGLDEILAQYGTTEEEFFQSVTEEQVRENLILNKAIDFLIENSVDA